jgi:hypothetical protein
MIPIMSPLALARHILINFINHDPNYVPLAPAGHVLVDLVKHDPNFVPLGPSWTHFGKVGFGFGKVTTEENEEKNEGYPRIIHLFPNLNLTFNQ